ncbi:unnamed protein product, partial [Mesorhabditis spiculigera]
MASPSEAPPPEPEKQSAPPQLTLRNCTHVVEVARLCSYITEQTVTHKKPILKCPTDGCTQDIHENDVEMALSPIERDYDQHLRPEQRIKLLYLHHSLQIIDAFGGPLLAKPCPVCRNIYAEREGCRLVECPVIRCRTRFCWDCGLITDSLQHFISGGPCRMGSDDLERWSLVYHWMNGGSRIGTLFFTPFLPVLITLVLPLVVCFYMPLTVYRNTMQKARMAETEDLMRAEVLAARFRATVRCILSIFPAILLGFVSLGAVPGLVFIYFFLSTGLGALSCFLDCLGLSKLRRMINASIVGEAELQRREARTVQERRGEDHPDMSASLSSSSSKKKKATKKTTKDAKKGKKTSAASADSTPTTPQKPANKPQIFTKDIGF